MFEINELYKKRGIPETVYEYVNSAEENLSGRFRRIDETAAYNQIKVISAMQDERVSEACLYPSTGYGYNDIGRETLEKVYASVFKCEDALVRPLIASGTHAISTALGGNLRPGDELLCPAGGPYDTLEEVIGIRRSPGSLAEQGISCSVVELKSDGSFDLEKIRYAVNERTRMAEIQKSCGYQNRKTFSNSQIGELISFLKNIKPDIICMVDNCYGEFVERTEPTEYGADLVAGSLIKNPGGGIAPIGGYICGRKEYVENSAFRLTAPGLGKEVGATLGVNLQFFQGLFMAPCVAAAAEKGALLASSVYSSLGFETSPSANEQRYDIIQRIRLGSREALTAFCRGIQFSSPVDGFVDPEPFPMPGYDDEVIMAAGTFIQGSSIELSADGPLREPYNVYFQGGLNYEHARYGIMLTLKMLLDSKIIDEGSLK